MPEIVDIPLSDLLLDPGNPRLEGERSTQQQTALELAEQQGQNLVNLAADIVANGLDPTALPAVIATDDRRKRYKIVEGNRRVLALRALDTPSLVSAALKPNQAKRMNELSRRYADDPLDTIPCVLFDSEDQAQHWILLRHTGQNEGVGLVGWQTPEQDRYKARHTGKRTPAGQVLDFVEKHGTLSVEAIASPQKIITTLDRMLSTPYARRRLGVDVERGQVLALYPTEEIAKSLSRMVEDFKLAKVKVPDLYTVEQRTAYADGFVRGALPKKSTLLAEPVLLDDLTAGRKKPRAVSKKKTRATKKKPPPRTTIIPSSASLNVTTPRINVIYNELLSLNAENYSNACSVLLRVFIELSVDHLIDDRKLMSDNQMRNTPLAKRLKTVASKLHSDGKISAQLQQAIGKIADGPSVLAPSIPTINQYIHNRYVFPKPSELYATWDEIAPLMNKLWP